jgi:23S rRNA (uridine2552-2'-O)-methyltransferase
LLTGIGRGAQKRKINSMAFNPQDHYFRRAKKENYLARSAFKLEEIDQKYKIVKNDSLVLDLGCAPGSWSQYILRKMKGGRVMGVDLTSVELAEDRFSFVQGDILNLDFQQIAKDAGLTFPLDLVVSDMAPKTTGIRSTDQARSMELCEMALSLSERYLKKNGSFVCKFFHSDDFSQLRKKMESQFQRVEAIKPDSTRKISKEIFLVGLNKKNNNK